MTVDSGERRYRLDGSVLRFPGLLIGGSPLRLFRLTNAGRRVVDRVVDAEPVRESTLVTALLDAGAIHPVAARPARRFGPADVTTVVPTLGVPLRPPADGAIVVDDGSQPAVPGATVRLERNRGPAAARNAGLERVTTPLVAFVDADIDTPPGWLDALLPHFDDPRVALVAPRVRTSPGDGPLARYEHRHGPLDLGDEAARVRAGTRVAYVPAAALVCRREALVAVGGFDDLLRYGEDVDLVWRLDAAGWRCRYEPAVEVIHAPRPDWIAWARQRASYGSSAAPLARRHPGALAPLRSNPWSLAAWAAPLLPSSVRRTAIGAAVGVALGLGSAIALVPRLRGVPARASIGLALRGHWATGTQLAVATRRALWPVVAVAALRSSAARRGLVLAAVAGGSPIRVVDDVAYSVGVWRGMITHRIWQPIVPAISAWPPRRTRRRGDLRRAQYRRAP